MQNVIIKKSQLVYSKITGTPAAGQTYPFLDNANLSAKKIRLYGIECFTATQLSVDEFGNTVIPAAGAPSLTVTLVDSQNNEVVSEMPVYNTIRSVNGGFIVVLDNIEVVLSKCKITLNATTSLSINQVVAFNFYYTEA